MTFSVEALFRHNVAVINVVLSGGRSASTGAHCKKHKTVRSERQTKIMGWLEIANLIARFGPAGVDLAQKLWEKWSSGTPPTAADFEELRALASKTPRSQMEKALTRAGIKLDSDQGKALLALV